MAFTSLPDGRITAPPLDRCKLIGYPLLNNLLMRLVEPEDAYEGHTSNTCGGLVCTSYQDVYLRSTTVKVPGPCLHTSMATAT